MALKTPGELSSYDRVKTDNKIQYSWLNKILIRTKNREMKLIVFIELPISWKDFNFYQSMESFIFSIWTHDVLPDINRCHV